VEKVDLVLRVKHKIETAQTLSPPNVLVKLNSQLDLLLHSLPPDLRGVLSPTPSPNPLSYTEGEDDEDGEEDDTNEDLSSLSLNPPPRLHNDDSSSGALLKPGDSEDLSLSQQETEEISLCSQKTENTFTITSEKVDEEKGVEEDITRSVNNQSNIDKSKLSLDISAINLNGASRERNVESDVPSNDKASDNKV